MYSQQLRKRQHKAENVKLSGTQKLNLL